MKVIRKQETAVNSVKEYQVGDQIQVGKYTAICQKVTERGAIFLLDQYLDKTYQMNHEDSNKGGYDASDLRKNLNEDFEYDPEFDEIRESLVAFENGDLVRIPTVGELFDPDDFYIMDDTEQWELMKERKNRIVDCEGEGYEWGWLQNAVKDSSDYFAIVNGYGGDSDYSFASYSLGVRPVFMLVE